MKVTLNITEDTELRAAMKEAIGQQVKSIVRDELQNLVQEELRRKVAATGHLASPWAIQDLAKQEVHAQFAKLLPEGVLSREQLTPMVTTAVENWFKRADFERLVSEAATAKINKLITTP